MDASVVIQWAGRASLKYRKNKIGLVATPAKDITDGVVGSLQNFLDKLRIRDQEYPLIMRKGALRRLQNQYSYEIMIVDTYGDRRAVKLKVMIKIGNIGHPVRIEGVSGAKDIDIKITLDKTAVLHDVNRFINETNKIKFYNKIKYLILHEIGHSIRRHKSKVSAEEVRRLDEKKYYRLALEVDADLIALINFIYDLPKDTYDSFTYKDFFKLFRDLNPKAYKYLSTPKWRKKIILRLHREGIVLK